MKPFIQVGDQYREMNDVEHAQYLTDQRAALIVATKQTADLAAKKSAIKKLAALGLTADEIAAL